MWGLDRPVGSLEAAAGVFEKEAPSFVHAVPVPRQALRTSMKSQFLKILITFGDECPQNGCKNEPMAQITSLG